MSRTRIALAAVGLIVLGLVAARSTTHVCDGDAQLYRVVARNAVERGDWVDLSYLPSVHPVFREHLPFGLWPTTIAILVFGDDHLPLLRGFWSLAILALVFAAGRTLLGDWHGTSAVLLLGTTDVFLMYTDFPRLDGSLAFFALASVIPWLRGQPGRWGLVASTTAAAAACAIKGPFGLVPLAAVVLARTVVMRSWRTAATGALAGALAAAPVVAFLVYQAAWGDASWWTGYVEVQLQRSAVGARPDGHFQWWFPFWTVARQFWPGLVFIPFSVYQAWRSDDRNLKVLGLACLAGLFILCLPTRKVLHHAMVMYPMMSLFAAVALHRWLQSLFEVRFPTRAPPVALALAAAVWGFALVWPFWIRGSRCLPRSEVAPQIARLSPGSNVVILSWRPEWRNVAALAAERRVVGWRVPGWKQLSRLPVEPSAAIVAEPRSEPVPAGWVMRHQGPEWSFWSRDPGPPLRPPAQAAGVPGPL